MPELCADSGVVLSRGHAVQLVLDLLDPACDAAAELFNGRLVARLPLPVFLQHPEKQVQVQRRQIPCSAPAARFCSDSLPRSFTSSPGKSSGFTKSMESPPSTPSIILLPSSRLHGSRFGGDCFNRGGLSHHAGGCGRSETGIMLLVGTRRSYCGTCLRGSIRSRRMDKEELLRHNLRCERRTAVSRDLSLGQIALYTGDLPARQLLRTPARCAVPCAHAVGSLRNSPARVLCRTLSPNVRCGISPGSIRSTGALVTIPERKRCSFSSSFPLHFDLGDKKWKPGYFRISTMPLYHYFFVIFVKFQRFWKISGSPSGSRRPAGSPASRPCRRPHRSHPALRFSPAHSPSPDRCGR